MVFISGMRFLLCLFVVSGCHATRVAVLPQRASVAASDCGEEIPGIDLVAQAPVLLLGELHGLIGPPEFAVDLACRLALTRSEAVLALEMFKGEQGRIDTYLASEGRDADRANLLGGRTWTQPFQDGYTSQSRLEMFERARRLIHAGLRLRVLAVKDEGSDRTTARGLLKGQDASLGEKLMADSIIALAREKRGAVIMLVGETHVQNAPDTDDPNLRWMGVFVHEQIPGAISLYNRYAAGEAWLCVPVGEPIRVVCGRQQREDSGRGTSGARWKIDLFAAPDKEGVNGTFDIGPARPSDPAIFLLRRSGG